MATKKKSGSLEFNQANGITFILNDDPNAYSEGSHQMNWEDTPVKMARALRKAADWLDKHATSKVMADID